MNKKLMWAIAGMIILALLFIPLFAQQQQSGQTGTAPQAGAQTGRGGQPGGRGGRPPQAVPQSNEDPLPKIPIGFTPIFNGKDLTGWHISKTNHHGTTPDYHVLHGVNGKDLTGWHISKTNHHGTTPDYHVLHGIVMGTQQPFGKGGILLTDKKYKNVEVYMEVKPDWGCDSGLFFWTDEDGGGYQVMLDYLPGGTMVAGIYGERLTGVNMNGPGWESMTPEQRQEIQTKRTENWQKAWKREQWNAVRARIEGNPPRITTWLNDEIMFQGTDTANHATNGATEGSIAIQVHMGERWRPAGFWRWRVIAVKELPN